MWEKVTANSLTVFLIDHYFWLIFLRWDTDRWDTTEEAEMRLDPQPRYQYCTSSALRFPLVLRLQRRTWDVAASLSLMTFSFHLTENPCIFPSYTRSPHYSRAGDKSWPSHHKPQDSSPSSFVSTSWLGSLLRLLYHGVFLCVCSVSSSLWVRVCVFCIL